MQPQLKGIEIEAVGCDDDDFAVEHAVLRQPFEQGLVQLGKVPVEGPEIPALDIELCLAAKHDGAKAVPLGLVEEFT